MTMSWSPTTPDYRSPTAMQPVLGPLCYGDLCTMTAGRVNGRKRYCQKDGFRRVLDVDGSELVMCQPCVAMYFPTV